MATPRQRPAQRWFGRHLTAVPPSLIQLVDDQAGVVTRSQLRAAGFNASQVAAAVRAMRWQTFGRRVVVMHNGRLTIDERRWAAVLIPAKPAALCGPTASELAGLSGFESRRVHVLVSHDCQAEWPDWVRVHHSRRFSRRDIQNSSGPPRTRAQRALIDAAAWSSSARRACAILCAGVQQRLVTPAALESELAAAGSVRHCLIMRSVLGDIAGGGHTLAELDLAPLAARAGLPAPRRQVMRREPGGRVRYVDAEFDLPDGTRLVVEIDGAVHLKPASWWADMSRQNELVIDRSPVLRFDSVTIRLEPERVVDQLRRMRLACAP